MEYGLGPMSYLRSYYYCHLAAEVLGVWLAENIAIIGARAG